jgi:hypothetical protein
VETRDHHPEPEGTSRSGLPSWLFVLAGGVLAVVGLSVRSTQTTPLQDVRQEPGSSRTSQGAPQHGWFTNTAEQVGIDFVHTSGAADTWFMPEIMAGGVCLLDYNRDGYLDAYFVQGGRLVQGAGPAATNRLYRNRRDGTFEDVSAQAGARDGGYGMGCACGDFDNDGWTDLYITNVGKNALYRNRLGEDFEEVTDRAGVGDAGFGSSAAFCDYDRDGDLDLFVANYIRWSPHTEIECRSAAGRRDYCMPTNYNAPARDTLYRNNGDGTFSDVSALSGIDRVFGHGLGVVCTDLDSDGYADIVVANDMTPNQLWLNQGDGTFRDEALLRGVAYNGEGAAEAGMGIDAQDVDGDLDIDVFMTHMRDQTNTLYINDGAFWEDGTVQHGLSASLPYTGFGTALIDLNNDGFLDIYVANGRVVRGDPLGTNAASFVERDQLFQGTDDFAFREISLFGAASETAAYASRGAAFGDYDNDGDVDVFVVNRDAPASVLRNDTNETNHWITFDLVTPLGSPAIGTRVRIEFGGARRMREVRPAYSYCSSNDPRVSFGLGRSETVDVATITWPDGVVETLQSLPADRIVRRAMASH